MHKIIQENRWCLQGGIRRLCSQYVFSSLELHHWTRSFCFPFAEFVSTGRNHVFGNCELNIFTHGNKSINHKNTHLTIILPTYTFIKKQQQWTVIYPAQHCRNHSQAAIAPINNRKLSNHYSRSKWFYTMLFLSWSTTAITNVNTILFTLLFPPLPHKMEEGEEMQQ